MRRPRPERPGPGQESVWDYPRPPALRDLDARVVVRAPDGRVLAETTDAVEVLETSHPPGVYLPRRDVDTSLLARSPARSTVCEWKGAATYWDLAATGPGRFVGWSYEQPTPAFRAIAGHLTFYPERVGEVTIDGEVVRGQPGDVYGGWVTDKVVGPFKGGAGSMWW